MHALSNTRRIQRIACMALALALMALGLPGLAEVTGDSTMLDEQLRLEEERGLPYYLWTIEQKYELQQAYLDEIQAFSENTVFEGMPEADEVQQDDAVALAMKAVTDKYGDAAFDASLERQDVISFHVYTTGERLWVFDFFMRSATNEVMAIYHVQLDAVTGDVIEVHAGENGHG